MTDHITEETRTNVSAMVCKRCGVVKLSRHYMVAMDLCHVGISSLFHLKNLFYVSVLISANFKKLSDLPYDGYFLS